TLSLDVDVHGEGVPDIGRPKTGGAPSRDRGVGWRYAIEDRPRPERDDAEQDGNDAGAVPPNLTQPRPACATQPPEAMTEPAALQRMGPVGETGLCIHTSSIRECTSRSQFYSTDRKYRS